MNLPKFNSADGRCYWMKPEVQEELQPLFDQCIQDAIDGRITRLDDSHWPPVVVSSQGAPFEVWQLLRAWTEIQRAETLDAEKAIAFSENLRRQSRWGEIDHHLLDMLKRELQEKYFVATGDEDDRFWDREYSLKPGIRAEQIPEPLLRFACYVAVSYKVYGLDFQYLDANYLFGLVEKVRPDMVKKLREHGTGRLPLSLQKRKTEHFTASANDAFAVIRITARDNTEECCHEVLDYLCEILEQEDFPRSYAVEFKGPEKSYLPITGLPKKGVNQLFAPDHIADRFPCVLQHFLRAGFCFFGGFLALVIIVILVRGKTAWNDLGQVDFCLQQSVQAFCVCHPRGIVLGILHVLHGQHPTDKYRDGISGKSELFHILPEEFFL